MFHLNCAENSKLTATNNYGIQETKLTYNAGDGSFYPATCAAANNRNSVTGPGTDLLNSSHVEESNYSESLIKPLMQMNGRKVLGPPEGWVGPVPPSACELFVRRIPKDIDEQKLIKQFFRFGRIYEIRLPMDFNQASRGYCYVKYTNEEDAACAMEVLSHYFVTSKKKLEILHSYEKCRLFVSNIPKNLCEAEVKSKMRYLFPSLERMYTRVMYDENNAAQRNIGNPGYIIIQFPTHMHALEAKKYVTPGMVRMWGRDLKVIWANEERDSNVAASVKTLFLRNVDLAVNKRDLYELLSKFVPRTEVGKISKVRMSAFVDFESRESAEICYRQLQGTVVHGRSLGVEWAKPSENESLHNMRNIDFDSTLRLKCIANQWQIPIIIFGCHFEIEGFQYCAVMLRNDAGITRAIFCILQPHQLVDIHSRVCEVACLLIETIGEFPDYNYVFYVDKDEAHVLGMITHNLETVKFIAARNVPKFMVLDLNEIIDLSTAVALLGAVSETQFLQTYYNSLQNSCPNSYLEDPIILGYRYFGAIHPNYRNKPPLKHNLNNTQIVLALCYTATGTNKASPTRIFMPTSAALYTDAYDGLHYVSLKLLPIALIQSRYCLEHDLSHVQFGGNEYYHPAQRVSQNNSCVMGASYKVTLKQPSDLYCYTPNEASTYKSNPYGLVDQHAKPLTQYDVGSTLPQQQQIAPVHTAEMQNYDMQQAAAYTYFPQENQPPFYTTLATAQMQPAYTFQHQNIQQPAYTLFPTDSQQQAYAFMPTDPMSTMQQSFDMTQPFQSSYVQSEGIHEQVLTHDNTAL